MKRLIAVISVLALCSQILSAQPFRRYDAPSHHPHEGYANLQEIGLSYGIVNAWSIAQTKKDALSGLATKNGYNLSNFTCIGSVNAEYFYRFRSLSLGAGLTYSYGKADEYTESKVYKSDVKYNSISLMVLGRMNWKEDAYYNFYSKLGIGADFVNMKDVDGLKVDVIPAFQVTVVGAEWGRALRLFAEAGFGTQGLLQIGARCSF